MAAVVVVVECIPMKEQLLVVMLWVCLVGLLTAATEEEIIVHMQLMDRPVSQVAVEAEVDALLNHTVYRPLYIEKLMAVPVVQVVSKSSFVASSKEVPS